MGTLLNAVPEFKSHDGRNKHLAPRGDRRLQSTTDRGGLAIDQGDACVCIEQVVHLKISRRGAVGCWRPLAMKGPSAHWSIASNHFAVSAMIGSSRTPPET